MKMLNKFLTSTCRTLERRVGYCRLTEIAVSKLMRLGVTRKVFDEIELLTKFKSIIVSLGMPSYLDNISEVLSQLHQRGFKILVFPEWGPESEAYNREMVKYSSPEIFVSNVSSRLLPFFKTDIFLSSIAGKHFYFPDCKKRVYYFHSTAGLAGFTPGGFDSYDVFLASTEQQKDELELSFRRRNLASKKVFEAGYPKLDKVINRINSVSFNGKQSEQIKTIVYAPTYVSDSIYQEVSCLSESDEIISCLLNYGYRVIFRPHPLTIKHERNKALIDVINSKFRGCNYAFDESLDYFDTYREADLLLTDVSGTAFMFRTAFGKPVVFFCKDLEKARKAISNIERIGPVESTMPAVLRKIEHELLCEPADRVGDGLIYNPGFSTESFVEIIEMLAKADS